MKKCMKCGHEFTDDVCFCGNCGSVFDSRNYQGNNSQNNYSQNNIRNQQTYQNRQNNNQNINYSAPVYCRKCGGFVDNETGFCSRCGHPSERFYSDNVYKKKKKDSSLTIIIVILLIILLTCTGVFGYIFFFDMKDSIQESA